jgi:hypothetical protein
MDKPGKSQPRPLSALLHKTLGDAFARRGFASAELVTRWNEIVGPEIAEHSQPEKIQWSPTREGQMPEPGRLVLRVEGPVALEIQHLSAVILERVNRFFGWHAVGAIGLRQAPLLRAPPRQQPQPDPHAIAQVAASLTDIRDPDLRDALARLGGAIKPS